MEKYCRLLFATLLIFAVCASTAYAQPYYGAARGDVYATSWQQGWQQGPIPLGAGYAAPVAYPMPTPPVVYVAAPTPTPNSTPTLAQPGMAAHQPSAQNIPSPYIPTPTPASQPQPVPQAPKTAQQHPVPVEQPAAVEVDEPEDVPFGPPASRHTHHSRFARSRWFQPVGTTVPNMIGDSTAFPTRLLTYSYMGLEEVRVPNPNYVPWVDDVYTDVPLGVDTGLKVNDDLLAEGGTAAGTTETGNISRDQFLVTYDNVRKTTAVPMPVTPTMYISSLNMAESFNADAQDRFYFDLRYFGGGESFGYSKSAGGVFTSKTDVSRATFGIEKRITENQSIELRLPLILVGLKSSQTLTGNDKAEHGTEFGNLSVVYKNTWRRTAEAAFCWGVGLNTPTAPGIKLRYQPFDNGDLISGEIRNCKWSIVPYVGFEWNKDNDSFGHMVAQLDFAAGKNKLDFTDKQYGLTRYRTSLKEYSLLRFNIGAGRWIYENPYDASIFKLGIMGELHFTTNVNVVDPKTIGSSGSASDNYFVSTPQKRNWSNVNLIFGIPMITPWTCLTTFVGVPVTNTRCFDVEGGISADMRF